MAEDFNNSAFGRFTRTCKSDEYQITSTFASVKLLLMELCEYVRKYQNLSISVYPTIVKTNFYMFL